ncbi:MAG: YcgN family cysteine cluster protein [Thiopseudomonas sp.]|nr:YcgN family cysteine cluster protein [Thiopseudomonas sp.]MCK9465793.1 YcgN family cysteine cluster protein [Thiopseudomonas sp.]
MAAIVKPFWQYKTLTQMTPEEWDSLCDGCGLCCLQKLEDQDDGSLYYTRIACKLLDLGTARCSNYSGRQQIVPECIALTPDNLAALTWLPKTCAYRLLHEKKPLPAWHHLVCGDVNAVHAAGISQLDNMLSELDVAEEDWEKNLIFRA